MHDVVEKYYWITEKKYGLCVENRYSGPLNRQPCFDNQLMDLLRLRKLSVVAPLVMMKMSGGR